MLRLSLYCAGVQIVGGVLSILSGVVLVLYFAKLDTLVEEKYYRIFGVRRKAHCVQIQYCFPSWTP